MSKEVSKKKSNEVAVYDEVDLGAWGDNEFDQSDIIIPKIILMQGASQLVSDGVARPGEYLDSVSKEVLGSADKPLVITPIHMKKFWRITQLDGNEYKFERMDHVNASNLNADKEFSENNVPKKRQMVYQFYVLVEDKAVPYILSMKGISFGAGKQLANEVYVTNKIKRLPPPGRQFKLSVEDVPFDGKKYKGFKIMEHGPTPMELVKGQCFEWFKTISVGEVREDHSDEKPEPKPQQNNMGSEPAF